MWWKTERLKKIMRCNSCGHERPRTGNCPHCGAEPGARGISASSSGSSSSGRQGGPSLRDWKDPSASSQSRNSRPVFVDPRSASPNSSSNNRSIASWRNPASSTYSRSHSQTPSRPTHDDWEEEDYGYRPGVPAASPPERSLPRLPDSQVIPEVDVSSPEFIPATTVLQQGTSSFPRIMIMIAGVVAVFMVICGICGGIVQGKGSSLAKLAGFQSPNVNLTPVANLPAAYTQQQTLLTPAPKADPIFSSLVTARQVIKNPNGSIKTVDGITPIFRTNEVVNVVGKADQNIKQNDTFSVRWYFNSQEITNTIQVTSPGCCKATVQDNIGDYITFTFVSPTPGMGQARIYYNQKLVATLAFAVVVPSSVPTPTATPTGVPSTTPTPKPAG
jgi:hypothetical protein